MATINDPNEAPHHVAILHAQHHPELPIQPLAAEQVKRNISDAQRASLNIGHVDAEIKRNRLNERLLAFVKEQDEKLEQIAKEEDTNIDHCCTLVSTSLKQRHKMNARNTFVSLKAFELNADHALGNKLNLKEIQAAVEVEKRVVHMQGARCRRVLLPYEKQGIESDEE
ncbi:hypothetical protein C8J56DRAFT_1032478 [Mycena floridula]|nr:hypothetical protein C8J56DRAFT_1032478 [Mycena floridula]